MSRINFELPFFFFFVFITIGFLLSWYLYRKEIKQNNLSKGIIYLLFFLRFLTFTILSIFLLQPKIVKSKLVEELMARLERLRPDKLLERKGAEAENLNKSLKYRPMVSPFNVI